MKSTRARFLQLLPLLACGLGLRAEPAIIAKARAHLGSEAVLNAVTSVHMVGTVTRDNPADPAHPINSQVEIIVARPYKSRVTITTGQTVEVDAVNGYDGWHRHEEADPAKWKQSVSNVRAIRQLRANAWQNLAFYRSYDNSGPEITDLGRVVLHGVPCERVAFAHDPATVFYRFFDLSSGRLVATTTNSGSEIHEEGDLFASGIRFPHTLVTTFPGARPLVVTLTFTKVTVNESFPDSLFSPPDPRPRKQ
jgi:hypothetical protein